jgi:hypothetical protein
MRRLLILVLGLVLAVGPAAGASAGARAAGGKALADQVAKFYKSAVVAIGTTQSCTKMGKGLQAWTLRSKPGVAVLAGKIKRMGINDKIAFVTEYSNVVGGNQALLQSATTLCASSKQVRAALALLGTLPHD